LKRDINNRKAVGPTKTPMRTYSKSTVLSGRATLNMLRSEASDKYVKEIVQASRRRDMIFFRFFNIFNC
jgi:hypothetical protein